MDAQQNAGIDFSYKKSAAGAKTITCHISRDALKVVADAAQTVLAFGAAAILSDQDLRERLLDALPALAGSVGKRLVVAA